MLGESVQKRVGGGIVALAGSTKRGGDRRKENESGEIEARGEFVQVHGGVELWLKYTIDKIGGEVCHHRVVHNPSSVHDSGERALGGDRPEQRLQLLAIADIARHNPNVRPQLGELREQRVGTVGSRSSSAGKYQVTDAVRAYEMARDVRPNPTCASSDQHGTVSREVR
jgi:hypothetical protein